MAVRLSVTSDFKELAGDLLTKDDMRDLGDFFVRNIRTQTEAGLDDQGRPFKAYSPMYAQQKQKALGHSRVDLTVSGRMLNDMQVTEVTNKSVTISFISQGGDGSGTKGTFIQRSAALGAADKAAFNDPTRNFFGISEEKQEEGVKLLDELLQKRFDAQR